MYQDVYVLRVRNETGGITGFGWISFYPVIGTKTRDEALQKGVKAIQSGIDPDLTESQVDAVLTLDEWLQVAGVWL